MLWRLLQWQLRETEKDSRATLIGSLYSLSTKVPSPSSKETVRDEAKRE